MLSSLLPYCLVVCSKIIGIVLHHKSKVGLRLTVCFETDAYKMRCMHINNGKIEIYSFIS